MVVFSLDKDKRSRLGSTNLSSCAGINVSVVGAICATHRRVPVSSFFFADISTEGSGRGSIRSQ